MNRPSGFNLQQFGTDAARPYLGQYADHPGPEQALLRLHSPCCAHYYPRETHAFHVMFWRENALHCWRDSFEFLGRHLPLAALPSQPPLPGARGPGRPGSAAAAIE